MASYTLGKRDAYGYLVGSNNGGGLVNGVFYTGTTGLAGPTVGSLGGPGDRIVYLAGATSTSYPTSGGVNANELWQSIASGGQFTWYIQGVAVAQLSASGFSVTPAATFGNTVSAPTFSAGPAGFQAIATTGTPTAAALGAVNGKALLLAGSSVTTGALPVAIGAIDGSSTYGTFSSTGLALTGATTITAPSGTFTGNLTAGTVIGNLNGALTSTTGIFSGTLNANGGISGTSGVAINSSLIANQGITVPNSAGIRANQTGGTASGFQIFPFTDGKTYFQAGTDSSGNGAAQIVIRAANSSSTYGTFSSTGLAAPGAQLTGALTGTTGSFSSTLASGSQTVTGNVTASGQVQGNTVVPLGDFGSTHTNGTSWTDPTGWADHLVLTGSVNQPSLSRSRLRISALNFQNPASGASTGLGSGVIQHINNNFGTGPLYLQPVGGGVQIGPPSTTGNVLTCGGATFTGQINGTSAVFSGTVTASSLTGTVASGGTIPNGNDANSTAGIYFSNNNTVQYPCSISIADNNFGASKRGGINLGSWRLWQDSAANGTKDFAICANGSNGNIALAINAAGTTTSLFGSTLNLTNASLAVTNSMGMNIGFSTGTNNQASLQFTNAGGSGSASNYVSLGLQGGNQLTLNGAGLLTATSSTFAAACQAAVFNSTTGTYTSQGGTVNRYTTYGSSSGNGCQLATIGSGGAGTHVSTSVTTDSVLSAYGGGRLFLQTAATSGTNNSNPAITIDTNNKVTLSSTQSLSAPGGISTAALQATTLASSGAASLGQIVLPGAYNTASNAINLCNNGQGITWGNSGTFSQIVDNGNLEICTDDIMNFRIAGTGGHVSNYSGDAIALQLNATNVVANKPVQVNLGGAGNQAGLTVIGGGILSNPHTFSPSYSKDNYATVLNTSNGLRDGQNFLYQKAKAFFQCDIDSAFGGSPTSVVIFVTHNKNMPIPTSIYPEFGFTDALGSSTGSPLTWSGRVTNCLTNTCEVVITCMGGSAGQSLQAVTGKGCKVFCTLTFWV